MKIERKFALLVVLNTLFVLLLLAVNFLVLRELPLLFSMINILSFVMLIVPPVLLKYVEYRKIKLIEKAFPAFLRDFVEGIRSGMTVEQTVKNLRKNDYGELNEYVKRMAAQLDWGIPVEKVLIKFAESTNSNMIKRLMASVIESHRFGGNLADTLEALTEATTEVERLKAERRSNLYSLITKGYIIYFVFVGVMVALGVSMIPTITEMQIEGITPTMGKEALRRGYEGLFRNLLLIQGIFSGLSIGKMAEGSMISGIKHSMIMVVVGLVIFTIAFTLTSP